MELTIFILVAIAAILGAFSQEFIRLFKRIGDIGWLKLLLPLMLVSWIIEANEMWGAGIVLWIRVHLLIFDSWVMKTFSFMSKQPYVYRVIFLAIIPCTLQLIHGFRNRKKRVPDPSYWANVSGIIVWIMLVILMVSLWQN